MRRAAKDTVEQRTSERDVMVARQPIYNNRMGVYGYELLFRSSSNSTEGLRPTEATAQVLATTILNFGLDDLVLHRKAVINVTRAFLDIMLDIQLPTQQVILDIPDNIAVDDKLVEKLRELGEKGYGISVGGLASLGPPFTVDGSRILTGLLQAPLDFHNLGSTRGGGRAAFWAGPEVGVGHGVMVEVIKDITFRAGVNNIGPPKLVDALALFRHGEGSTGRS